ncbi:hypothetical protein [Flavobacterium cellulosilyticum]|uniref:Efflux RND transporter periplasmic adaptor subunit n=1 Tax=Flavobacterium cellulosilyticum TaxID=2541731 RepID=A0A4R5CJB7_9FLAO|nr:hypothetical protein [Flavobacterium cellulosilyticum]TDD97454.1 hypothetical protein E0F76_09105 [Flavobacterium cellulosilyticum]
MKNNKTKKIIGFFAMLTVLLVMGCKEQAKEQPANKEVIVVPAPAHPVIIEKAVPDNSTTIKLDKNGLEVDAKKVNVKVE